MGKLSFDDERDDPNESLDPHKPSSPSSFIKFKTRPLKVNRGIRTSSTTGTSTNAAAFRETLDVADRDFSETQEILTPLEEMDLFEERRLRIKADEARQIKSLRQKESRLEDYVSLEDTTQKFLDDSDMATIFRGQNQAKKHQTFWEDPEGGKTGSSDMEKFSSESEGMDENPSADILNEDFEAFDSHKGAKVSMIVNEGIEIDRDLMEGIDFQDEEMRKWEIQQIKKGSATGHGSGSGISKEAKRATRALASDYMDYQENQGKALIDLSFNEIISNLNKISTSLTTSINEINNKKGDFTRQESICINSIDDISQKIQSEEGKGHLFNEMLEYINNFGEMVDEILPKIKSFEEEQLVLLRENRSINLSNDAFQLFEEISQDYSDPTRVMKKFSNWKCMDQLSYDQCFVDLCLSNILEIFIRLKLLDWRPLNPDDPTLAQIFQDCCEFVTTSNDNEIGKGILSTLIIPRLIHLVIASFDPFKEEHAQRLGIIFEEISKLSPKSTRALNSFQSIIYEKIIPVKESIPEPNFQLFSKLFNDLKL